MTRINIYGDIRDADIIVKRVKLDAKQYTKWVKEREVDRLEENLTEEMTYDIDAELLVAVTNAVKYEMKGREIDEYHGD